MHNITVALRTSIGEDLLIRCRNFCKNPAHFSFNDEAAVSVELPAVRYPGRCRQVLVPGLPGQLSAGVRYRWQDVRERVRPGVYRGAGRQGGPQRRVLDNSTVLRHGYTLGQGMQDGELLSKRASVCLTGKGTQKRNTTLSLSQLLFAYVHNTIQ